MAAGSARARWRYADAGRRKTRWDSDGAAAIRADFLQHLDHALFPLLGAKPLVHFQPFGDDLLHVQTRIQGGVGIPKTICIRLR